MFSLFIPHLLQAAVNAPAAAASTSFLTPVERQIMLAAVMAGLGVVGRYYFDLWKERRAEKSKSRRKVTDLQYLSAKAIELNRYAQHILDITACDHVSIYAAANGEFLAAGDSIKKFIMQAEASQPGETRYMELEPLLMANVIPHLVSALYVTQYVLMWPEQCDDEKANRIMRQRNYSSSIAMLITVTTPTGRCPLGLVVLNWKRIVLHPVRNQLPEQHSPFETYVTPKLQQAITKFKLEVADLLDNKPE